MTRYPALHQRLCDMAWEEMRSPENQLLYLIRQELEKMEEKCASA